MQPAWLRATLASEAALDGEPLDLRDEEQTWSLGTDASVNHMRDLAELSADPKFSLTLGRVIEPLDEGIAWVSVVICAAFCVFSVFALGAFFRARNVFEIKARSARLVLLSGIGSVATLSSIAQEQATIISDFSPHALVTSTLLYMGLVGPACCYGSRAIRLAVLYRERWRRLLPWLSLERNHLIACLFFGTAAVSIPIVDRLRLGDGVYADLEFIELTNGRLWKVLIGVQVAVIAIYPFVRKVDDVFRIGPELRVMLLLMLSMTVVGKLGQEYGSVEVSRWINMRNMGVISVLVMFSFSVVHPLYQLRRHPLRSTDPHVAQALVKRKDRGLGLRGISRVNSSSWIRRNPKNSSGSLKSDEAEDDTLRGYSSHVPCVWTYEKVAEIPALLEEFEAFSRKALCQESVLFLRDTNTYQAGVHDDLEGKEATLDQTLQTFQSMVRRYILDGSPDEINISATDKKVITDVYSAGSFRDLQPAKRRYIFARAYLEVRFMLESNLMTTFVSTKEFKLALAGATEGTR